MQQSHFRTVWISDIHLGLKDCKAKFLLNFLESTHCDTLYLVGDLVDFWSLRRGGYWSESHSRVLQAILAKSIQGVRIIYVPGNHDEVARDYIGLSVGGIEITHEVIHETADGRHFLVTHGDECDRAVKCGNPLKHRLGDWLYDLLLWANRWTNFTRRCFNYPYWSLANALKQRIGRATRYIARFEAAAAHEAVRRTLDGVICGHIHKARITRINGVLYCNDGDWVESCTALVEHHNGALEILYWADETVVVLQEHRNRSLKQPLPEAAKVG
jgi:UDP-2,3-diacylglucosamine pyrophosphatase LpxH